MASEVEARKAAGPLNDVATILAAGVLVGVSARGVLALARSMRTLSSTRDEALTDALTTIGNRRKLLEDLEDLLPAATATSPVGLAVLDLDGFKRFNDTFGHPAGDALLRRLGRRLDATVRDHGSAYRLGGDEFCVVVTDLAALRATVIEAADALGDSGEGYAITASYGLVVLPHEASTAERALQVADQRLYEHKGARARSSAARETRSALVQALQEREPAAGGHMDGVGALVRAVGRRLGLDHEELDVTIRAAELHDIGEAAVPDAILAHDGPLEDVDPGFARQHTVVGERMLRAAPALRPVATVVRASRERFDGSGYPDGLAGEGIPVGARIVAVCDAYDAMIARGEPSAAALEALAARAGSDFDPAVVEACAGVVSAKLESASRAVAAGGRS